ncbi:hypothetical protein J1N35_016307 [Gossypium stocksii]|uniref:Uncharacterized protein n=1 Tax=Gossypium stocksii TaxID=47602 RepID=A0A9D4A539_9ROSI|nr:hypothetical protein J1N35_016307 [Gossypium stocksii]
MPGSGDLVNQMGQTCAICTTFPHQSSMICTSIIHGEKTRNTDDEVLVAAALLLHIKGNDVVAEGS